MAEREPIDPRILTQEYWGHSPEDRCGEGTRLFVDIPLFQIGKVKKFASQNLDSYLSSADRNPVRKLAPDEVFDGNQATEGTIIKMREEILRTDGPRHAQLDLWGVVTGFDTKKGRKITLLTFLALEDTFLPMLAQPRYPIVRVSRVEHRRFYYSKPPFDRFRRVNEAEVHKMGKGVREEAKRGFHLPSFGTIFQPRPQQI